MRNFRLHLILFAGFYCSVIQADAQIDTSHNWGVTKGVIQGADTIPMIMLPEIRVYHAQDYEYLFLKRKYRRLIHNVKRAYPYARIAGDRLKELDRHLATLPGEKERKAYIESAEKEIMEQFESQVRKLTIAQGIILVKLIDRETGRTSYEVIKDLKGGLTAFFWQGIARIFGNNLKEEYDPDRQDRVIEDIVQGIELGFI
ncbi:MAG TPA: DUF4294 domain-containing protein [Bacteroides sp.]|nr:DUF4294 domain-containing protein [Bacteroides sp.]